jgi:hypothetical protein
MASSRGFSRKEPFVRPLGTGENGSPLSQGWDLASLLPHLFPVLPGQEVWAALDEAVSPASSLCRSQ